MFENRKYFSLNYFPQSDRIYAATKTMTERKPSRNGFLQVQNLRENNGEKNAISIDCCKYPQNILLDEFSMGFLDERKRLVVDSGHLKISVPHSITKLTNSHLFGAQNLNFLNSLYFLEKLSRKFAYAQFWQEFLAIFCLVPVVSCHWPIFSMFVKVEMEINKQKLYSCNGFVAH